MDNPDYLAKTPVVGRTYCPGCEPEADVVEEILDTRWCSVHVPYPRGSEDDRVVSQYLSGSAESGGEDARRLCDLIHRGEST